MSYNPNPPMAGGNPYDATKPIQGATETPEAYEARIERWMQTPAGMKWIQWAEAVQAGNNENRQWQREEQQARIENARQQLALSVGAQRANEWAQRENIKLQKAQMAQSQRQFEDTTGMNLLQLGASLRGPRNVFQALDLQRGAANSPIAPYLQSLMSGRPMAAYSRAAGIPEAASVAGLGADMLGQGNATYGSGSNPYSGQMANNYSAIQQLGLRPGMGGPGWWNSLSGSERDATLSGLEKSGFDIDLWDRQRKQSGVGQGQSNLA